MASNGKRVLICNPFISLGGIATFTLTLCTGLKVYGNELCLLLTHFKGDQFEKAETEFDNLYPIESVTNSLTRITKIYQLIKNIKPEVIILNNCPSVNYILPFISSKIRVISVIHSDDKRYYKLDTRFSGWLDHLVCPSNKLAITLPEFLFFSDRLKIQIIPHGVKATQAPSKDPRILKSMVFVGNLDKHKGVDLIVSIVETIVKKFNESHLFLVGRGPMDDQLRTEINFKNLNGNITLIPYLEKPQLTDLFSRAEILLFPTRLESFGLVIPEAMAEGVIPVVTKLKDITDQFIENGFNGYLCEKDNASEFSDRIAEIFSNNELKSVLAANAKESSQINFSEDKMIAHYQDLISNQSDTPKPGLFSVEWFLLYLKNLYRIIINASR